MADSTSPKVNSADLAKKVQRQLTRSKEKVKQKLGMAQQTRDEQFEIHHQRLNDQQTDGNRLHKDLRNYVNAVRDMREASRRLSQSLFDAYENDWAGEQDLGAIVEGEDLLWNDFEVKILDQAVRSMESYINQFPDVREKVAKRGRKLVDYDSSRHHLEALQAAKKPDDTKIKKAKEEMILAKSVFEGLNNELKDELPVFYDSRIGCYVAVFSAMSSLRDTFYKEMRTLNIDLQNVMKELRAQHPDKVFTIKAMQSYGSLRRRSLLSPKAWKSSFSEFHRSYSPKTGTKFSFKTPDKPRRSTLSREGSSLAVSPLQESPIPELTDPDAGPSHSVAYSGAHSEAQSSPAQEEHSHHMEEEEKGDISELQPPAVSVDKGDKAPASDSSSERNISYDSESLELQLSAADNEPLHIVEREDSPINRHTPKPSGLENGGVSGFNADTQDPSASHTDGPAERQIEQSSGHKSTDV